MFKRTFELRMVKNAKKNEDPTEPEVAPDNIFDYGLAVEGVLKVAMQEAVKGVLAYKALDTLCKIAVNRLSK